MRNIFHLEPALILGVLSALITLGVAFGLHITGVQSEAILGAAAATLTLGAAITTRQLVTPVRKDLDTGRLDGHEVANPVRTRL